MTFKENLKKKIRIGQLGQAVRNSLMAGESGVRVDKEAMRALLAFGSFTHQHERDLDLFILQNGSQPMILVLDNDLTIYRSTVSDVVLRKSPTIKEMVNIRNAIKILNDSDVVASRKAQSLSTIQDLCLAALDLTYTAADIENLRYEGAAFLEAENEDGVIEIVTLFQELLSYQPIPEALSIKHCRVTGHAVEEKAGLVWGPLVIYNQALNILLLAEQRLTVKEKSGVEMLKRLASGKEKAALEGKEVFQWLKNQTLQTKTHLSGL